MKVARWPALILIPALLIAAALVGTDKGGGEDVGPDRVVLGPQVAAPGALSGLWFCAGGTGVANGFADHRVVVINTSDVARAATVTAYASRDAKGARPNAVTRPIALAAFGRAELRLGDLVSAPYVAATVEVDGGGVLVEHSINGTTGADRAPCSSSASSTWFVPIGATTTAAPTAPAREILAFFNPFPGDAVIDVVFSTDTGFRGTPELFKGLVVPGGSVVGVDLATAGVTVSAEVAAAITTRTGRVVVDRIQAYDEPARKGLAISAGVAGAAETWLFPAGNLAAGRQERIVVFNPNDTAADVDVELRPTSQDLAVEPFELVIRPHQHAVLDLATEPRLADYTARGESFSTVVRSADGTGIAAERIVTVAPGTPGAGVGLSTGSAVGANRLFADVTVADPPGADSTLVVMNPSRSIAQLNVWLIANGARTAPRANASLELQPGGRAALKLADLGSGTFTIVVESTALIVGERELVIGADRAVAPAVPDAATSAIPDIDVFGE
jgi:hypothetical protein